MYDILPFILIVVGLSIIVVLTARKFPLLANLDVANIPAEKEAKFKERIAGHRLKRSIIKHWNFILNFLRPIGAGLQAGGKFLYKKLLALRDKYKTTAALPTEEKEQKVERLFLDVEDLIKKEDFKEAEKNLIEIIGLDNKNIKAFKTLGRIYLSNKNYDEAKQTFEYVLKLREDEDAYSDLAQVARQRGDLIEAKDDYIKSLAINNHRTETYFDLASVCEEAGDMEEARDYLRLAMENEPNNPRFLDMMIEISIMLKDRAGALMAYGKLAEANPENQKLEEIKARIDEI